MNAVTVEKDVHEQVARILHSEELRTSEASKRLLKFLAERSASGQADDLKEYIIAIDGMGKPTSYDPRFDSSVRIQVRRLRQKLADYYQTEGRDDSIVIDVPKGQFKLCYSVRQKEIAEPAAFEFPEGVARPVSHSESEHVLPTLENGLIFSRIFRIVGALIVLALAVLGTFDLFHPKLNPAIEMAGFTPELRALWEPFVLSKRPLITAIEDPLFVEFQTGSRRWYVRDKSINEWKGVQASPTFAAFSGLLDHPAMDPSRYFTSFGEVHAAFIIAKLLGSREQNLTIQKSSQLAWQQLADNDVIFIGVQHFFFFESQLKAMPVELQLLPSVNGIQNLHPGPGEPAVFTDQFTTAPEEEGVVYALVTNLPGPLGTNHIESFTSNRSAGYVGAVKEFADPKTASVIVDRLKKQTGGRMPTYFQVVLRVKFKADVPLETECLLTRELH